MNRAPMDTVELSQSKHEVRVPQLAGLWVLYDEVTIQVVLKMSDARTKLNKRIGFLATSNPFFVRESVRQ
jgi:hypothetical protein